MEKTIYMPLMGEGVDCWCPVRAMQIAEDVFEIAEEPPEDVSWRFAPLSRVRCRNKVFADGKTGLAIIAYAVESHPYYQVLKDYEGRVLRIVLSNGEEAVVRVTHVDAEHEDFIYDLLSTNPGHKIGRVPNNAAYAAKFADLVSARLEE
jgi:hypothetical protein